MHILPTLADVCDQAALLCLACTNCLWEAFMVNGVGDIGATIGTN